MDCARGPVGTGAGAAARSGALGAGEAVAGSPLAAFLGHLRAVLLSVAFEGQGPHRGLHVNAEWNLKK